MMMKRDPISDGADKSEAHLSSVINAMRLIKIFSDDQHEIGISDMSKRLQLPKSTVCRLIATLLETGMLAHNAETGKYRLGLAVFELGSVVQRKMHFTNEHQIN